MPQQTIQYDQPAPPPRMLHYDAPEEPGFLDRELPPMTSYKLATLSGIQSIGRGVRDFGRGVSSAVRHPIDTAEAGIDALFDAPVAIKQVPGAIHDINQSPDPVGTYAKVAQKTAGEGAGQALGAIATEGVLKGASSVAKPAVRAGARAANTVLEKAPGTVGAAIGAGVGRATGIPGGAELGAAGGAAAGRAFLPKIRVPGENFGLPKPIYPGAPLPETPPTELLQARTLAQGGREIEEPAAGLGRIPVAESEGATPSIVRRPGEVAPEMIRPRAFIAKPSAPIPSRSGLLLGPGEAGSMAQSIEAPAAAETSTAPGTVLGRVEPLSPIAKPSAAPQRLGDLLKQEQPPPQPFGVKSPAGERLGDLLNETLGGKLPEGHTPVKSTAIVSYKYNPAEHELEAVTKGGQHYIHGDVSPEQFAKFENASSKGKAWNELRKSSPEVAKVVNGRRVPAKPPIALRSATPESLPPGEDLTPEWENNLNYLLKKKARVAKP